MNVKKTTRTRWMFYLNHLRVSSRYFLGVAGGVTGSVLGGHTATITTRRRQERNDTTKAKKKNAASFIC